MSGAPEPTLTWHEREIIAALRRLANARANLVALEYQAGGPALDADDVERALALDAEREALVPRAKGRRGAGARDRIAELEGELRLVLDRLGVDDLDELRGRVERQTEPTVDPTLAEFARRELEGAAEAWRDIRDLELPPVEEAGPDDADVELGDAEDGGQVVPFDRRSAS